MSSPPPPSPSPPPPLPPSSSPRATAILAVPAPPPPSDPPPPRKFPAPCWTHEETLALISSYQDKWYSLRRRNLRTADWDAVAEEVTRRCPGQSPAKTSAQCRHKMEKLRKRYRTEKQRISSLQSSNFGINNRFFGSSWVLFDLIHSMELGSGNNGNDLQINNHNIVNNNDVGQVDLEVKPFSMHNLNMNMIDKGNNVVVDGNNNSNSNKKGDLGNYFDEILLGMSGNNKGKSQNHEFDVRGSAAQPVKFRVKNHQISRHDYGGPAGGGGGGGGGYDDEFDEGDEYVGGGGGRGLMPPPGGMKRKSEGYGKYDEMYSSKMVSGVNGSASRKEYEGGSRGGRETGLGEMVASIKMLGEGLVKMEKMKIEMMRDIEKMRMEMEMRRSQMILESQQLIVNAFVEGLKKSKKFKPSEID